MEQIDPGKIARLTSDATENELIDLAELFKVFGDSTRIRILYDLFRGEKSVTEICTDLEMNQSAISHQLKLLKNARLVRSSLADEHVRTIIAMGRDHIKE